MQKNKIKAQYEREWKERLVREPNEQFDRYERNWVLGDLFRRNERFLDLASGNSIVGEYVKKNFGCEVHAIDMSEEAIKNAKRRGVSGKIGSVEERLPYKKGYFDTVFWGDNIEHVFYPEKVLKEISRVLTPEGRVIISTPNQAYWRYRLYTLIKGALPKTEGEDNKPWEWTHIRFFNREILRELLTLCGFKETVFLGVSRRRFDIPLLKKFPGLFGMIMVVEAVK